MGCGNARPTNHTPPPPQRYAGLWRSLIFADEAGIRRHSEGMNAGGAVPVFAAMLTQRPWAHVSEQPGRGELSLWRGGYRESVWGGGGGDMGRGGDRVR